MKILNFGSCNIDYVYRVPHITAPGETLAVKDMELFSGGKGLNQSVAAARAGGNVYHAGYIGTDGEFLRDILDLSGVDTSYLKTVQMKNGHAVIQVEDSAENCIFIYRGTNGILTEEYIDEVLDCFEQGDILMLQNETNLVSYMIERASSKGMVTVFNPSPFNTELKHLDLGKVSYVILNETESKGFLSANSPEEFLDGMTAMYPELHILLTLGRKGCLYAYKGERISQAAFNVEAVDTTGAGDTFTGYFVSLTASGADPAKALKYSCAAAALAITKKGAAPSIPAISDVKNALTYLEN